MTRRTPSWLVPLLLVVGLTLAPLLSGCAGMSGIYSFSSKAKNVILFVGDGMRPSHSGAAWLYSNRVLGKNLRMVEVMNAGHTAYLVNGPADAIVTESAAAAHRVVKIEDDTCAKEPGKDGGEHQEIRHVVDMDDLISLAQLE